MPQSDKDYRKQLGLPASISSEKVSELLEGMMSKSIGSSMGVLEVEVLGTVETQGLHLQVRTKVFEETN